MEYLTSNKSFPFGADPDHDLYPGNFNGMFTIQAGAAVVRILREDCASECCGSIHVVVQFVFSILHRKFCSECLKMTKLNQFIQCLCLES